MFEEYVIFEFGIYKDSSELSFIQKIFEIDEAMKDQKIKIIGRGLINMDSFYIPHAYVNEEGLYINLRTSHRFSDKKGLVPNNESLDEDGELGSTVGLIDLNEDSETILEFLKFHNMKLRVEKKKRFLMG